MIITLTEALLERLTATDGRILRDRLLCGFAVRANKRRRTFLIATSVKGRQVRMMLDYWPLMNVGNAHSRTMQVLRGRREIFADAASSVNRVQRSQAPEGIEPRGV